MTETKILKVTKDNYNSLLSMLNSSDIENRALGLSCIEQIEFKPSIIYILLLRKNAIASPAEWQENAPVISGKLEELTIKKEDIPSYKDLSNIIRTLPEEYNVSDTDIHFFMDDFGNAVKAAVKGLGYDFIEEAEINVNLKTNRGEQRRTIS